MILGEELNFKPLIYRFVYLYNFVILKSDDDTLLPYITQEIVSQFRNSDVYDSLESERLFKGRSADAIWCYFGKDAYADMVRDSKYTDNKELLLIPGASHTDLYDGGETNAIPFDKLTAFFTEYLR